MKKFLSILLVAALAVTALAFAGCDDPEQPQEGYTFVIPDGVTSIGKDAFDDCADNLALTVGQNSYAMQYAIDNDIHYICPDTNN